LSLEGKTGLFGGTFNPLHNAHLLVAEKALSQFGLREVIFVPCGIPPHKEVADGVNKEDRYEMVRRAIAGRPRFSVSRIEIDRAGPSYTIDTIRAMKGEHPEGLCFIVGADLLSQIETWKEPEALLASVPFIVAPRAGVDMRIFSAPPFDRAEIHFLRSILHLGAGGGAGGEGIRKLRPSGGGGLYQGTRVVSGTNNSTHIRRR